MSFMRSIMQVSYYLGLAFRRTFDVVSLPVRSVAGGRWPRRSPASRRGEIMDRISQMTARLHRLESSLTHAEPLVSRPISHEIRRSQETTAEVASTLAEALSDPDPGVRCHALGNVEDLGGEEAAVIVLQGLNDSEPVVRRAAARAAGRVGSHSAVFSLILMLDDPDPGVSQEAKAAIEHITGKPVRFDPAEDPVMRRQRIEALKAWWKEERFSKLAAQVRTVVKS